MKHIGTQTITTERLVLRPFSLEDAPAMYHNWAGDEKANRFMSWSLHPDMEASREVLRDWVAKYDKPDYYHWAITLEREPIGSLGLHYISDENRLGEAGYCVGSRWWGMGIMTEAVRGMLGYLFEKGDFHRVYAIHDVMNPASGRVMIKAGMSFEGVMRGHSLRKDGSWGDMRVYGILRDDWEARRDR